MNFVESNFRFIDLCSIIGGNLTSEKSTCPFLRSSFDFNSIEVISLTMATLYLRFRRLNGFLRILEKAILVPFRRRRFGGLRQMVLRRASGGFGITPM